MNNKRKRILSAAFAVMLIFTLSLSVCAMTVKVAVSSSGGTVDVEVSPDNTVFELKEEVQKRVGVSAERQILMFAGNPLEDDKTLEEYGVEDGSSMAMRVSEDSDTDYNKRDEETTKAEPEKEVEADGKIVIGSLIVNSSNIRTVSYVAIGVVAFIAVILIILRRKS